MAEIVFNADVVIRGRLTAQSMTVPSDTITDSNVQSGANFAHAKLQHRHLLKLHQSGNATAETKPLYIADVAGSVVSVKAASIVAATGDSTCTIDVRKNGTTVLTGTIVLDNANTARTKEVGTLDGAQALAIGDMLEVVVTVSAGTGTLPTGLLVEVVVAENGS